MSPQVKKKILIADAGLRIQFMHDEGEGTVYWLEGTIERRITKLSRAIKLKYAENYFRVGELRVISSLGEEPKPLPEKVCTNLTGNVGWTKLTDTSKRLPVGEDSVIEVDLNEIPTSKREEEVNQEDAGETPDDQLGDDEICEGTGCTKIIPYDAHYEPDVEIEISLRFDKKYFSIIQGFQL